MTSSSRFGLQSLGIALTPSVMIHTFAMRTSSVLCGWSSSMGSTRVQVLPSKKGAPLLSHYCSIITSLEFSPDGRYILSADRDFKIRVTVFPKEPLQGAHEIQTFCLGHTEFVTCIAFVWNPELTQGYLMSGSGDSTVRLWDVTSGSLLNTCEVSTMAGHLESNESKPVQVTVTDICAIPNSSSAAVSIQRQVYFQGIVLLKCDLSSHTLSIAKFHPPLSTSTRLLWMVSGASSGYSRVRVISYIETEPSSVLEDEQIPGGTKLLEQLQGKVSVEESVMSATAEAVRAAMSSLLMKKQYSDEKRESKQNRNSPKEKKITKHNITKEMAQQQNSPRDQRDSRPQGDVFSVSGDDDVARKQGAGSSNPGPKIVTMGSVDTVTIGEALEVTALSLGDKPVDRKDAAAIQAAETRATGDSKTRPGGLAEAAQEAAATNERTALEEAKVTIADILTDATEKLPGDKVVTSEDAEAVVGAELRNSPEMKTTPGGVADSMSAGARLNQPL
ncbi:hypothetical protein IGI04_039293 [Brassica rapa subsp. trilocularis]|uniref:SMP domain-containing protein n=1 Tax=Brassica rapa subsp. trilocularis TaxID=1813537 RepID=A0ABQ7KL79_BRACM|nr:hypothetical protein IGI04_039293 [Brassica rapa subsp. trilocularis]